MMEGGGSENLVSDTAVPYKPCLGQSSYATLAKLMINTQIRLIIRL